jgi:hypothetical protein
MSTDTQDPSTPPQLAFPQAKLRGRRPKIGQLHPSVKARMLQFLRLGAYDYVAAEALGIVIETFTAWMDAGRECRDKGIDNVYSRFFLEVVQAKAEGRLLAEIQVRNESPQAWLKNGPGRTKPGRPGWTETIAYEGSEGGPIQSQMEVNGQITHEHKHAHLVFGKDPATGSTTLAQIMGTLQQCGIADSPSTLPATTVQATPVPPEKGSAIDNGKGTEPVHARSKKRTKQGRGKTKESNRGTKGTE